ncbi:unnamed protein product [Meganyctiphanes norvegica]|uniref:Ferritin n=1 Tax=Meganyctiphanes norvegica TaxID=48144 RepID=A0AAV2QRT6_MEGNR
MASQVRQNYDEDCEASINKAINMYLQSSYVYLAMSYHMERDDVSLPGFCSFFKGLSEKDQKSAKTLMKYQNKRGGRIVLAAIDAPSQQDWENPLEALQTVIDLEKQNNQSILQLHALGIAKSDAHIRHFLDNEYVLQNVDTIQRLGNLVTRVKRVGATGLGLHIFDKELQ